MLRTWWMVGLSLALGACGSGSKTATSGGGPASAAPSGGAPAPAAAAAAAVSVGSLAAYQAKEGVALGKVVKLEGSSATLSEDGDTNTIALAQLEVATPAPEGVRAGEDLFCHRSSYWMACRVKRIASDGKIVVMGEAGSEASFGAADVARPGPAWAPKVKSTMDAVVKNAEPPDPRAVASAKAANERAEKFLAEAAAAGHPARATGWKPKEKERILWDSGGGFWYPHVVTAVGAGTVKIDYGPGREDLAEQALRDIYPMAANPRAKAGDFVLANDPQSTPPAYRVAKVLAVKDGSVHCVDETGTERDVPLGEIVPLVPDR